jgi:hypothetical protein
MEQLGVVKPRKRDKSATGSEAEDPQDGSSSKQGAGTVGDDVGVVQWGGSGGLGSAVDMEEQEAILTRLFKPHKVKGDLLCCCEVFNMGVPACLRVLQVSLIESEGLQLAEMDGDRGSSEPTKTLFTSYCF